MNLNNLAALAQRRDDFSQAEELYRRALQIKQRALGPKHADVAVTLNNLACLYRSQNMLLEAEPLFRQALEIFKATFGPGHPKLLAIHKNIHSLQVAMAADNSSVNAEAIVVSANS